MDATMITTLADWLAAASAVILVVLVMLDVAPLLVTAMLFVAWCRRRQRR